VVGCYLFDCVGEVMVDVCCVGVFFGDGLYDE